MARGVGGRGPANIMKHLKGIDFPASKREVLDYARSGAGPNTDDVVNALRQIDDREYNSPTEIMQQIGNTE